VINVEGLQGVSEKYLSGIMTGRNEHMCANITLNVKYLGP